MNLREWMSRAIGTNTWGRMEKTLPGALSKCVDQMIYNFSDKTVQYRGKVLELNNSERMYVGLGRDEWPKWDGRLDKDHIDVLKTLRTIQHLLEAQAFAETSGERPTPHVCKTCGGAAP